MITRLLFQLHGLAIALIVGPLGAVTAALLVSNQIDGREAMAAVLSVLPGAVYVLWLYRRQWRFVSGQLNRLADHQASPVDTLADGIVPASIPVEAVLMPELQKLSHRLAQQDAVFEALSNPVLLLAVNRRVMVANQAARQLLGRRLVGRDISMAMRHPDVLAAIDRALASGTPQGITQEIAGTVPLIFDVRIMPLSGLPSSGQVVHDGPALLILLHDVTALRRAEQMRADFIANASHELRTPLASLVGFIETLRGPAQDDAEARTKFLGIMADQARRMTRLVDELLVLSRIEVDEHHPPTDHVAVAPLLENIASTLEMRAAERKLTLDLRIDDVPDVIADRDQMIQMIQNLVDNAISYATPETMITISAQVPPRDQAAFLHTTPMVAITVADQGPGIPREHLSRLTERFYRVDPARSRAAGGTGLGLAIVKHIANRHRGRLMIDSDVGKGSVFTLYIPAIV